MNLQAVRTDTIAPAAREPKPVRVVRGPDGRMHLVRRGVAALAALQSRLPKVLRIGVIRGQRIVQERIVRTRETVFVGASEKNHFVVEQPGLSSRFPLFEIRADGEGDRYFLTFRDDMKGRLSFPIEEGGTIDLDAIRSSGRARRGPDGWQVPLTDSCRGKVTVGDTTLLFQFVVPPLVLPPPRLPASVRGGWISRIDASILVAIGAALVLHAGVLAATVIPEWPKPTLEEILSSGWADMPLSIPNAEATEDDADPDAPPRADQGAAAQEKPEGETAAQEAPATPDRSGNAERREQRTRPASREPSVTVDGRSVSRNFFDSQQARIQQGLTLQNILGGGDGGPIGIGDAFRGSSATVGNLRNALEGTAGTVEGTSGGYGMVPGNLSVGPTVGPVGNRTSEIDVVTPDLRDATAPETRDIIHGNVGVGRATPAGDNPGTMDARAFRAALDRKLSGIRQCYDGALPHDPTLAGDIVFRIVINLQGGVRIEVESETPSLRASGVSACIERRLSTLNFASTPPRGGEFHVRVPFSFIAP